jgi:hypothetical protein
MCLCVCVRGGGCGHSPVDRRYAEAEPAQAPEVAAFILAFLRAADARMATTPMSDWSAARWMDFALAVHWVLENAPQGAEQFLWDLAELAHSQGDDWELWFTNFTAGAGPHGVNNAQALKSAAVWWRQTANATLPLLSASRLANMDRIYGMPTGMFCADEILCDVPEQKMPSRGTELCTVVEAMFSYNSMFSIHGAVAFADRAERIAMNALPATWASPLGGDMWAHQYLQAVNEV